MVSSDGSLLRGIVGEGLEPEAEKVTTAAWSPSGDFLAYGSQDGAILTVRHVDSGASFEVEIKARVRSKSRKTLVLIA